MAKAGFGDIGAAEKIWADKKPGSDEIRKKIMKKTLNNILGAIDTWNDEHVRTLKTALYGDSDVGPLWIAACTNYE